METCNNECTNCLDNCDKITGICDACKNGFFGNNCTRNCSVTCDFEKKKLW